MPAQKKKPTAKKDTPKAKGKPRHSTKSALPSQPNPPGKIGRPTIYTKELGVAISLRIALGESLRKICAEKEMPDAATVLGWAIDSDHDFYEHYARGRQMQAEGRIDEIDDLAKDAVKQIKYTEGGQCVDAGAVAAIKLLIDTRKWVASKVLPKIYGDKLEVKTEAKFIPLAELAAMMADENDDE